MGPRVRVLWLEGRRLCRCLANCANPVFTPPVRELARGGPTLRGPLLAVLKKRER